MGISDVGYQALQRPRRADCAKGAISWIDSADNLPLFGEAGISNDTFCIRIWSHSNPDGFRTIPPRLACAPSDYDHIALNTVLRWTILWTVQ
jgi:hypothetical protein